MEDGAFLGRVLADVVRGVLKLEEAIHVYEKTRMPRAWFKQQASFTMGAMYMLPSPMDKHRQDGSVESVAYTEAQNEIANLQTTSKKITKPDANAVSWNLWGAPEVRYLVSQYLRLIWLTFLLDGAEYLWIRCRRRCRPRSADLPIGEDAMG